MVDEVLKESWAYQEIYFEGYKVGLREGLQQAELQRYRILLEVYIQRFFPALTDMAKQRGDAINSPITLYALLRKLFATDIEAEAKDILMD